MTHGVAHGLLGLALACLLVVPSCRRATPPAPPPAAPPRPALGSVTLREASAGTPPVSLDLDALGEQLRSRLVATGLFGAAGATGGGAMVPVVRVRGDVALDGAEVEDKGIARVAIRLKLDTRPSEVPGAIEEDLAGQGEQIYPIAFDARVKAQSKAKPKPKARPRPLPEPTPQAHEAKRALFARLVLRVAGDLIDGFAAREKLRSGSADVIHAALRQDGGDLQEQAIRVAGERKLRDEVPALLALLDNPSEPVRDAALGALIQIGDRRAVTALTKSRSLRDRREMRKIIEAIATLGGDEALDYLSFIAASHDDDEIRALAGAAKARLERHGRTAP